MQVKYDKILDQLREDDSTSGAATISQLSSDPASPTSEQAWVLRTGTGGGTPLGLTLVFTTPGNFSYQFSYRTQEGTTVRVGLT